MVKVKYWETSEEGTRDGEWEGGVAGNCGG